MQIAWTVLKWLGLGFTGMLGGLQGLAFQALIVIALVSGAYIKGRVDCAAIHNTAALEATVREMTKRAEAAEAVAVEAAKSAAREEQEVRKSDRAIDKAKATGQRGAGRNCVSARFLRDLKSAR